MTRLIVLNHIILGTLFGLSTVVLGDIGPSQKQWRPVPPSKIFISPDHRQMALVTFYPARFYGDPESRVEIQTRHRRTIAVHDFYSPDGAHGRTVEEALWSPDSRYFVVTTSSSGGHSPWNAQPFVFSRPRRKFFELEDYVTPICDEHISFVSSHKLRTRFVTGDADFNGPTTIIDLAMIDRKARRHQVLR